MGLWMMAGEDLTWQLEVAEHLGVRICQEFMLTKSPVLNWVGSEGIGALAYGPLSLHDAFHEVIPSAEFFRGKSGDETHLILFLSPPQPHMN